jgi:hypothetical protein
MNLYKSINNFNCEAIDVFFVPRVAGQKGLRKSAWVSRLKKSKDRLAVNEKSLCGSVWVRG